MYAAEFTAKAIPLRCEKTLQLRLVEEPCEEAQCLAFRGRRQLERMVTAQHLRSGLKPAIILAQGAVPQPLQGHMVRARAQMHRPIPAMAHAHDRVQR